jgi:hypothetical protein
MVLHDSESGRLIRGPRQLLVEAAQAIGAPSEVLTEAILSDVLRIPVYQALIRDYAAHWLPDGGGKG